MAAMSTRAGVLVVSCMSTRPGWKAISASAGARLQPAEQGLDRRLALVAAHIAQGVFEQQPQHHGQAEIVGAEARARDRR